jgi:hypothetical protein
VTGEANPMISDSLGASIGDVQPARMIVAKNKPDSLFKYDFILFPTSLFDQRHFF